MPESVYQKLHYSVPELEHPYGRNIHLLADVVLLSELAELSRPETSVARANRLVRDIYAGLIRYVVAAEFPRADAQVTTRMQAVFNGQLIDRETETVVVDVARAGTLAAQVCFEFLGELCNPARVRQDHVYINRKVDDHGQVVGTVYSGSKIGGPVADAMVLIPDPMGATGGSLSSTVDIYKKDASGAAKKDVAKKYVAMNLIVTPEYVRRMSKEHPDVIVYAVRIDRGTSPEAVLQKPLGTPGETGLNDKQYIVPGLGGLGELLNNSWV